MQVFEHVDFLGAPVKNLFHTINDHQRFFCLGIHV